MTNRISEEAAISVKGSLALFFGNSIALVVNAASSILVASMLTPSEYGLFTLSLVLPTFFKLFTDWGVDQALIRNIARERSQSITGNIKDIIWTGLGFKFLVSGTLSLVLYLFADVFTTFVLKRPDIGEFVRLASLLVFSQTIYTTAISILTGFEKMDKRAHLNIIHALGKGILSPLFVYMGYGVNGVVLGLLLGSIFPSLIGLWLIIQVSRNLTSTKIKIGRIWTTLDYGAPLFIGNVITGIAIQFRGFLLSWFVPDDVIGNFGVASWFNTFTIISISSFGVALFPTFSKHDIQTKPIKTTLIFQSSIRYMTMFFIPSILLLISVSRPIISFLFGGKYPLVSFYLSLLLIPSLFIGVGSNSIFRFLNSQGDTRATMRIQLP
ncbi:MAG: oligosaccharide flippase family protein, partial [Candidatus Hodarchaeales archaeon]